MSTLLGGNNRIAVSKLKNCSHAKRTEVDLRYVTPESFRSAHDVLRATFRRATLRYIDACVSGDRLQRRAADGVDGAARKSVRRVELRCLAVRFVATAIQNARLLLEQFSPALRSPSDALGEQVEFRHVAGRLCASGIRCHFGTWFDLTLQVSGDGGLFLRSVAAALLFSWDEARRPSAAVSRSPDTG